MHFALLDTISLQVGASGAGDARRHRCRKLSRPARGDDTKHTHGEKWSRVEKIPGFCRVNERSKRC